MCRKSCIFARKLCATINTFQNILFMAEEKKTPEQEAEEQRKAAQEQAAAQQAAAQKMVEDQQKSMKKTLIISTILSFVMTIGGKLFSKFFGNKLSIMVLALMASTMMLNAEVESAVTGFTPSNGKVQLYDNVGKGKFSINATTFVRFTKSNMCYYATQQDQTWVRFDFVPYPWNLVGERNLDISSTCSHAIDLFGWGASGEKTHKILPPYSYNKLPSEYASYVKNGDSFNDNYYYTGNLSGRTYDWGYSGCFVKKDNPSSVWLANYRTLTASEWDYILNKRPNAKLLKGFATVNSVPGLVLLPDNWETQLGMKDFAFIGAVNKGYESNEYVTDEWAIMENAGAIFLPCTGRRGYNFTPKKVTYGEENYGNYWTGTSSKTEATEAQAIRFSSTSITTFDQPRNYGNAVRLIEFRYAYPTTYNKTIWLYMDKSGNATWRGMKFSKVGNFYYTVCDADDNGNDSIYLIRVSDPYKETHKVKITFKEREQPTNPVWTSSRLARYITINPSVECINKEVEVQHGTTLSVTDYSSDLFAYYRWSSTYQAASETMPFEFDVEHNENVEITVIAHIFTPKATGNTSLGTLWAGPGKKSATETYAYPKAYMEDHPESYPEGYYFEYKATPNADADFVGWVPETMLANFDNDEDAAWEWIQTWRSKLPATDSVAKVLAKFEQANPHFIIEDFLPFVNICGITINSGRNLVMHAIFKQKPSAKLYVESQYGTIYDLNGAELTKSGLDMYFNVVSGTKLALDLKDVNEDWTLDYWDIDGSNYGNECPLNVTVDGTINKVKAVYKEAGGMKVSYVCDFSTKATSNNSYKNLWVYDQHWNIYGGSNNNKGWDYLKLGANKDNIVTYNPVYIANKDGFGRKILEVDVHIGRGPAANMGINEWGVKVYTDPLCETLLYTIKCSDNNIDQGKYTFKPEEGMDWKAGYGIKVYWDLYNNSGTNGIIYVDSICYLTDKRDEGPEWLGATYTIHFLSWNSQILQTVQVYEGQVPQYTGETPTRPETTTTKYVFTGWDKEIVPATENVDYKAQFQAIPKVTYYTIRFLNWDNKVLEESQVAENTVPTYSGNTPVREEDETYTYTFKGWSPVPTAATKDQDYKAEFTANKKPVTGIDAVGQEFNLENRKTLRDGVLYIERNGKMYNAQGAFIK